ALRYARELCQTLDRNLTHRRLELPEALDGIPGDGEGTRVLDVNVRLQRAATLDQVIALDDVKLLRVWRAESVDRRPLMDSDRVDNERVAFVAADGVAIPRWLDALRMLIREIDAADVVKARQHHDHFLRSLNEVHRLGHG